MDGTGRILGRHRAMHGSWLAGSEARSQSDHPIEASLCAAIEACFCWRADGGQTMSSGRMGAANRASRYEWRGRGPQGP